MSLHNDSTETCSRVILRCDLQTATQRIPLYPPTAATSAAGTAATAAGDVTSGGSAAASGDGTVENFQPGSSVDHVLNHEVKDTECFSLRGFLT